MDPALIAQARDPRTFEGVFRLPDGTAFGPRWVITADGVQLSSPACSACHFTVRTDGPVTVAGPRGPRPPGKSSVDPSRPWSGSRLAPRSPCSVSTRAIADPSPPGERGRFRGRLMNGSRAGGTRRIANSRDLRREIPACSTAPTGSPCYATKIPDLQILRYSRYLDATGTHRLRGPEDAARYTAFITGADPMDFGPHHILTDAQRRVRFRYTDEVLYALGMYLMSLEPPRNADTGAAEPIARGEQLFSPGRLRELSRATELHERTAHGGSGVGSTQPIIPTVTISRTSQWEPIRGSRSGREREPASTRFPRCAACGIGRGCFTMPR